MCIPVLKCYVQTCNINDVLALLLLWWLFEDVALLHKHLKEIEGKRLLFMIWLFIASFSNKKEIQDFKEQTKSIFLLTRMSICGWHTTKTIKILRYEESGFT